MKIHQRVNWRVHTRRGCKFMEKTTTKKIVYEVATLIWILMRNLNDYFYSPPIGHGMTTGISVHA